MFGPSYVLALAANPKSFIITRKGDAAIVHWSVLLLTVFGPGPGDVVNNRDEVWYVDFQSYGT
jgi:hypothetical protein